MCDDPAAAAEAERAVLHVDRPGVVEGGLKVDEGPGAGTCESSSVVERGLRTGLRAIPKQCDVPLGIECVPAQVVDRGAVGSVNAPEVQSGPGCGAVVVEGHAVEVGRCLWWCRSSCPRRRQACPTPRECRRGIQANKPLTTKLSVPVSVPPLLWIVSVPVVSVTGVTGLKLAVPLTSR